MDYLFVVAITVIICFSTYAIVELWRHPEKHFIKRNPRYTLVFSRRKVNLDLRLYCSPFECITTSAILRYVLPKLHELGVDMSTVDYYTKGENEDVFVMLEATEEQLVSIKLNLNENNDFYLTKINKRLEKVLRDPHDCAGFFFTFFVKKLYNCFYK